MLLDLACGDNSLIRAYKKGYGVDVTNFGADILTSTFSALPFKNDSFDTISIVASLNYFEDPAAALSECHRVLDDSGRLVIMNSNPAIMQLWHLFREPWARRAGIAQRELDSMARRCGFRIRARHHFNLGISSVSIYLKVRE
jgi:SAM-dependent methyltransferase